MPGPLRIELAGGLYHVTHAVIALEYYRDTMADAKAAMVTAFATGDYTMQEIAKFCGVHYVTVSRVVNKYGTVMT